MFKDYVVFAITHRVVINCNNIGNIIQYLSSRYDM